MMEPTMMCEPLPEVLKSAIRQGAPLYNRGDYKGCAKAFLYTAEQGIRTTFGTAHELVLKKAVEQAREIVEEDPMEATWILRRAFDRVLTTNNRKEAAHDVQSQKSNECVDNEVSVSTKKALSESSKFETIVSSMKVSPDAPDIQRVGCLALAALLAPPMSIETRSLARKFVDELDGLDMVVAIMQKWTDDSTTQEAAIRLLCCLVTLVAGVRVRFWDQGVVGLVSLAMERFPKDPSIKAVAAPFMNAMMTTMLRANSKQNLLKQSKRSASTGNLMKMEETAGNNNDERSVITHATLRSQPAATRRSISSTNSLVRLLEESESAKPAALTEGQVRSLFSLWNSALATGDSRIVAKRYTKKALLLPTVSDEPRTTPEGIKDYFDHFCSLRPQGVILDGHITVGDGWAQDAGIYQFTLAATGQIVKARYSFTYAHEDGQWKIAHHHSSAMPEASKEPTTAITEDQVRGLFHLWNDSLDTGDAALVARRYSSNAVLLPTVSDEPRTTSERIEDYFVHFCAKNPHGVILESHVNIGTNWCKDVGIYEFTMGVDGSKVRARYSFVYVWEDGEWKISHHHSSAMPEGNNKKNNDDAAEVSAPLVKKPSSSSSANDLRSNMMKRSSGSQQTLSTVGLLDDDDSSISSKDEDFLLMENVQMMTVDKDEAWELYKMFF